MRTINTNSKTMCVQQKTIKGSTWYKIPFCLLLCFSFLTACRENSTKYPEAALNYSGDNRSELEKVLKHYSEHPKDSLKLKAAIFLIENMPGHYTYTSPFLEEYYAALDSVSGINYHQKKLLQQAPFDVPEYRYDFEIREDIKCLTADYLIHQIELAFRQWETLPWLEGLDFENFCEYLLPYRVDKEFPDYWRDSVGYLKEFMNYPDYYDDCRYSPHAIQNRIRLRGVNPQKIIPVENLKNFQIECIQTSKLQLYIYRSFGLPCAIDYIPDFGNRNGRHYWAIVLNWEKQHYHAYQLNCYRAAKVFRKTYSRHPITRPPKKEYIPPFFQDPFHIDVTELYLPTTDISLKAPRRIKQKYAYLAIFNDLTWKPIAISPVSGKKAFFPKMGRDMVYLPIYYKEESEMYAFAPPFIVESNGNIRHLHLDKKHLQKISLTRKYPHSSEHDFWLKEMLASCFEVSDSPAFNEPDTIHIINQKPSAEYQYIPCNNIPKKRYWRFRNGNTWQTFLSDLRFYDAEGQEIQGQIIGPDSASARSLFDDDPLSMGVIRQWIGVDFGKPVSVSAIRYLPRNDANNIFPDNDYELFYYDYQEGWVSMGIKQAQECRIEYDQVPGGTLYWLRNLTTGIEERIFTLENGKIKFW